VRVRHTRPSVRHTRTSLRHTRPGVRRTTFAVQSVRHTKPSVGHTLSVIQISKLATERAALRRTIASLQANVRPYTFGSMCVLPLLGRASLHLLEPSIHPHHRLPPGQRASPYRLVCPTLVLLCPTLGLVCPAHGVVCLTLGLVCLTLGRVCLNTPRPVARSAWPHHRRPPGQRASLHPNSMNLAADE